MNIKQAASENPAFLAFLAHAAATFVTTEALRHAGVHLDVNEMQAFLLTLEVPVFLWLRARVAPLVKLNRVAPEAHATYMAAVARKP